MAYVAKMNVLHDGKEYSEGDELPELTDEQRDALLEADAIEEKRTRRAAAAEDEQKSTSSSTTAAPKPASGAATEQKKT